MRAGPTTDILATNLRVLGALHRVLDVLDGLPVVVFKGPLLTQRAFGHLAGRASADNDVWLPEAHVLPALERLRAAGFAPAPHLDPALLLEQRGQVALWPGGDAAQVSLDLHVRPFARPYFDVDESLLLRHLEADSSLGRVVRTFDGPLAFCHAVAHYVQHHLPDDHLGLIARLWSSLPASSTDLFALAERTCGLAAVALALERSGQLDGGADVLLPLEPRARRVGRLLASFDGHPPGLVRKFAALYLTAPERLLSGMWESAFPVQGVLRERYGRGPRPWLLVRHIARVLTER